MNLKKTLVKNKVIRTTAGDVSYCGQSNVWIMYGRINLNKRNLLFEN